ncbi:MAG TPA: glycosyltransferase family 4 protein [bacterium]|nr:glycosyltransferase family 4 protein [bacterium]HQI04444.1 glycosyltransferase family 4 protein [bacterium]HRQ70057.1 glycosyltransferase family 4 protein [bacterium]
MNIWIINETTGSRIHGMVFRPYYLAKEFVKKGYEVVIFSGSFSHIYSNPPEVEGNTRKETIDGIEYCWIKTPKYSRSQSLGRIFNAFVYVLKMFLINKKEFGKPDVVIVTSPTPFSIINGYYYKKKFNARLIFEVRDIWPLTLIEIGSISKKHPFVVFTQFFENFSYKVSDRVVSVLPNSKNHMISHGMKEDKFVHIPNGIDIEEICNAKDIDPEVKNRIPEKKFIVMYAGKIGISNALEYLLFAAGKLRNNDQIHIVIAGDGSEKQRFIKLKEEEKLENVTFIDPVKKEQVPSLLSFADVFYIGWHKNNLYKYGISANKLFDYMYAGKPVIHSVQIESNDSVKESASGISVEPENPDAIANAVLKLYNMSENDRMEIGRKGKEHILLNHTYEKLSDSYIKIF